MVFSDFEQMMYELICEFIQVVEKLHNRCMNDLELTKSIHGLTQKLPKKPKEN